MSFAASGEMEFLTELVLCMQWQNLVWVLKEPKTTKQFLKSCYLIPAWSGFRELSFTLVGMHVFQSL